MGILAGFPVGSGSRLQSNDARHKKTPHAFRIIAAMKYCCRIGRKWRFGGAHSWASCWVSTAVKVKLCLSILVDSFDSLIY